SELAVARVGRTGSEFGWNERRMSVVIREASWFRPRWKLGILAYASPPPARTTASVASIRTRTRDPAVAAGRGVGRRSPAAGWRRLKSLRYHGARAAGASASEAPQRWQKCLPGRLPVPH